MAKTAKNDFKYAYAMFRSDPKHGIHEGHTFRACERGGVNYSICSAAHRATLARDGRHNPVSLATRLANHKFAKTLFSNGIGR